MTYLNRGNFMNWQVQWIKSSELIHRKELFLYSYKYTLSLMHL